SADPMQKHQTRHNRAARVSKDVEKLNLPYTLPDQVRIVLHCFLGDRKRHPEEERRWQNANDDDGKIEQYILQLRRHTAYSKFPVRKPRRKIEAPARHIKHPKRDHRIECDNTLQRLEEMQWVDNLTGYSRAVYDAGGIAEEEARKHKRKANC